VTASTRSADVRRLWLTAVLALTAIALAGCGGDDGDGAAAHVKPAGPTATVAAAEPILIKTRVSLPAVRILKGSTIGGSSFCPGGTAKDEHGTPEVGLVDRTITCQDGSLRMGFDPQMPVGNAQRGPWRIISGTGAYDEWEGSGQMVMRYDPDDQSAHPTRGREAYTGTVTH
jgi:hypothetical protein